ncbi:phage protease [Erwinia tracheiphila]
MLNSTLADPNDGWYQLLPAGHFSARDGRPEDVASGTWFMDADIARAFIEATAAVNQPVLFDYNHVTLKTGYRCQSGPRGCSCRLVTQSAGKHAVA